MSGGEGSAVAVGDAVEGAGGEGVCVPQHAQTDMKATRRRNTLIIHRITQIALLGLVLVDGNVTSGTDIGRKHFAHRGARPAATCSW